jgi:hypothetical protein
MAVTHSTAARNAATDAVTALLTAGSKLVFRTSTSDLNSPLTTANAVATLTFSTPAFGGSATGTATANSITSDTAATGSVSPVTHATLQTAGNTGVIQCQVAASGSDINMTGGLTVSAGDTVSCSSLQYTALNP